jgi:predicted MFS family arabinose efflux permease
MFFASLRLGPMARRWGDRRLLGVSGMLFGIYPLLLAFAQGPLLYWIASFVGGMVYAVISAALINRLMARVPGEQRAAGMAFHNLALNLGILIGSFSGPLLSDAMGLQQSLLVSAGLRVVAGILLWLWG